MLNDREAWYAAAYEIAKKFSHDWTTKWKKNLWKLPYLRFKLHNFVEKINHKDSAKISNLHGFREERGRTGKAQLFFRALKLFCVFCSEHRPRAFVKTHGTLIVERTLAYANIKSHLGCLINPSKACRMWPKNLTLVQSHWRQYRKYGNLSKFGNE